MGLPQDQNTGRQGMLGAVFWLLALLHRKDPMAADLPIIQKTYDLIKWYVPILNQLPRDQKFQLGPAVADFVRL